MIKKKKNYNKQNHMTMLRIRFANFLTERAPINSSDKDSNSLLEKMSQGYKKIDY